MFLWSLLARNVMRLLDFGAIAIKQSAACNQATEDGIQVETRATHHRREFEEGFAWHHDPSFGRSKQIHGREWFS